MRMLLVIAAVGCTEYGIQGEQDANVGSEPTLDTAAPEDPDTCLLYTSDAADE